MWIVGLINTLHALYIENILSRFLKSAARLEYYFMRLVHLYMLQPEITPGRLPEGTPYTHAEFHVYLNATHNILYRVGKDV